MMLPPTILRIAIYISTQKLVLRVVLFRIRPFQKVRVRIGLPNVDNLIILFLECIVYLWVRFFVKWSILVINHKLILIAIVSDSATLLDGLALVHSGVRLEDQAVG